MSARQSPLRTPVSLLAACAVALVACGSESGGERRAGQTVPAVEAVQARFGSLPLTQRLSGVVRARNQVEIYPRISAIVTDVFVQNGDAVSRDQPLIQLRDTEFQERLNQARASHQVAQAQLRRAQAHAREARTDLERLQSLAKQELASPAELEAGETRAEAADAEVELARAQLQQARAVMDEEEENLTQTVIRSPITGHVGNRNAEVGMLVSTGSRLFTVGQLDSVRVEVVVTDRMLQYIETGQRTDVSTGGQVRSAPLSRISPFLHPVTHSTEAEIDMSNSDMRLKPGMFVTVDVFYGESSKATLVPLSALYEHPATSVTGVYATESVPAPASVEGADASGAPLTDPVSFAFIPVEVVAQGRMEVAVRGIEPGTWVVTLGQNLLGGESRDARVRPVTWERVERLQQLQREDLMEKVIERQASP